MEVSKIRKDVELQFQNRKENWEDSYKSKAKTVFNELDSETSYIESLTDKEINELPDDTEESVLLYVLYNFAKQNKEVIQQFADKKGYRIAEGEEYLLILKKLDEGYTKIVYHIFMYGLWLENRHRRNYAITEGEPPEDFQKAVLDNSRGLRMSLSKNTSSKHFRIDERRVIEFYDTIIFCIDRQTSDKEKRDVSGLQWRRNLGTVFFEYRKNDGRVNFRIGNTTIRKVLKRKLEEYFDLTLTPTDIVTDGIRPDKFRQALKDYDEDDEWKILNIDVKKISAQPSVALNLAKKSSGKDIRPILAQWEEDLIDLGVLNVNRFWFQWNEVEARVNIKETGSDSLMLDSDIKVKSEQTEETVREKFNEEYGLPLDKELLEHEITGELEKLIEFILSDPPSHEIRKIEQGLIKDIEDLGIIKVKQFEGNEPDEEKIYPRDVKEVKTKKKGLRQYITSVAEEAGYEYQELSTEQIFGRTYRFARFRTEDDVIDVSIEGYNSFTDGSRNYLLKSLKPVLIANIGSIHDRYVEELLSSRLSIPKLVEKELENESPEEYFDEKISEVARDKEGRVATEAKDSYKAIQEIMEDQTSDKGTRFEIELFSLFKQVLPTVQQWGAKRRGNQPDGFAEIVYPYNNGYAHRSVTYDSKFTAEKLHFNRDDCRQARDYCARILGSEEVKKNETEFRNFIIITNRPENGNFGSSIAGTVNRMTSWDGIPVLMHIEFLLGLYILYNENQPTIKQYKGIFDRELYRKINGDRLQKHQDIDEDFFVELDGEDAEDLFENFKEEVDDERIDITSLREFLESDVYPSI